MMKTTLKGLILRPAIVTVIWSYGRIFRIGERLFFRIVVNYRGPFTEGHETSACWRYDRDQGFFVNAGQETNYER